MRKIFISLGDPSADLYASHLIKSIKSKEKSIRVIGLGGEKIKDLVDEFVYDIVGLNIHGFWAPIKNFPHLLEIFLKVKKIIKDMDLVLLLDFYGFNIKLAQLANVYSIPVFYYIPPQIWADRFFRIENIKKYIKKVFLIYPFEERIYKLYGIDSLYVGHPLMSIINKEEILTKRDNIVGLFPGSRANVIKWHLKVFENLRNCPDFKFMIFGLRHLASCYKTSFDVVFDDDYKIRRKVKFAVSTSGTVVIENSLLGIPTIVVYKLPFIWYLLAKSIIRVPYISIINIIFSEEVFPELIERKANVKNIVEILKRWNKGEGVERVYEKMSNLRGIFGDKNSSEIVANEIISYLIS